MLYKPNGASSLVVLIITSLSKWCDITEKAVSNLSPHYLWQETTSYFASLTQYVNRLIGTTGLKTSNFHVQETYPFEQHIWLFKFNGHLDFVMRSGYALHGYRVDCLTDGPYLPQSMIDLTIFQ
jgi:hypothetical protein